MTRLKYEYRLSPEDACEVQVRLVSHKPMGNNSRGASWRCYMLCTSPFDALRILQLLNEPVTESMVTP